MPDHLTAAGEAVSPAPSSLAAPRIALARVPLLLRKTRRRPALTRAKRRNRHRRRLARRAIQRFECQFPKPERNRQDLNLSAEMIPAAATAQQRDGAAQPCANN